MNDLKVEFGKRLKFLRERKGITQEQLAQSLGKSVSAVAKMEQGLHTPRFAHFEEIVRVLGVHPKEFFDFPWPPKG